MAPGSQRTQRNPAGWSARLALHSESSLLNAVQFATRTHSGSGGASFDTSTNRFLDVGKDKTYVVGGEPDSKGERIPTRHVPHVDLPTAIEHINRVRSETGNRRNALAGSWVTPDRVDLDASRAIENRSHALRVATGRNEEAIWDNAAGEDILTDIGKAKRAKP
jgi:hypothetical protein